MAASVQLSAEGPEASESPTRQRGSVRDLPDLTSRLIKEGLHEEYLRYRERYLLWRQGGASGAVGELSWVANSRQPNQLPSMQELWHPTPQKFDFLYTVSYWVAVVCEVGALLLTFNYTMPLVVASDDWYGKRKRLFQMVSFLGDMFFTFGCYLSYFELINLPETGRFFYFMPNWAPVRERVSVESLTGVVAYFVGMVVWDVSSTTHLMQLEDPDAVAMLLHKLPCLLGGFCFFLGGLCEVIHNWERSAKDVEWWISVMNFIAGATLFIGQICGMSATSAFLNQWCCAIGMALYSVTGIMLMVMWKGNDFGLTLLRQLNASLRAGSHIFISPTADGVCIRHASAFPRTSQARESSRDEGNRGRLSTRGVVFITIYCWLFACGILNCLAVMFEATDLSEHLLKLCSGLLWNVVVAIVLTIHSSVTSVPNQQPYRVAMLAMRGTLAFAAVLQTVVLSRWLCHLHHPSWD